MIAEALHDNRGKIDLQTVHAKVNTYAKKKRNQETEAMEKEGGMRALQIETEKKMLHQKELLLQQRSRGGSGSMFPWQQAKHSSNLLPQYSLLVCWMLQQESRVWSHTMSVLDTQSAM